MTATPSTTSDGWVAPPKELIRERFTRVPGEKPGQHVICDNGVPVFEYERGFAGPGPFEPFRQLRDGVWRNYALISPKYTSFAVVDLQTFDVIERTPSVADREKFDRLKAEGTNSWADKWENVDDMLRSVGFCPGEFHVTDNFDLWLDPKDAEEWSGWTDEDLATMDPNERVTGEFGFVSGCVWGDDWSYKVQYIDLSRLSDGIVTSDERFGYFPLPNNLRLADAVNVSEYFTGYIDLTLPVRFDLRTGKASAYSEDIPWKEGERP